jgi:hypothetical protein
LAAAIGFGPLIAWRLRGRRVDGSAPGGALLGYYLAAAALVFLVMMLTAVLAWLGVGVGIVAAGDDVWRLPGLIVGGAIAAFYFAAIAWLDVEAFCDPSPKRRTHAPLDVARLVATAAYVAYVVAVVAWASGASDVGVVDLILLLVGPGLVGAAVATAADLMVRRDERCAHSRPVSAR